MAANIQHWIIRVTAEFGGLVSTANDMEREGVEVFNIKPGQQGSFGVLWGRTINEMSRREYKILCDKIGVIPT
jgi:hypothetical protein